MVFTAIVSALLLGAIFVVIFANLATGSAWPFTGHWPALEPSKWYDVSRSAITMVGLVGLGGGAIIAYRKQRVSERSQQLDEDKHDHTAITDLRARFTSAADQLGHDRAAVRLAGVYSLVALSEDWHNRGDAKQQLLCVQVLCAYLRMPYDVAAADVGEKELRIAILSVFREKLSGGTEGSWSGLPMDFSGAIFDGGSLENAIFQNSVNFSRARFVAAFSFENARFEGEVSFKHAEFTSGEVSFAKAIISQGFLDLSWAKFTGGLLGFSHVQLLGGHLSFEKMTVGHALLQCNNMKLMGGGANFSFHVRSPVQVPFGVEQIMEYVAGVIDFSSAVFDGCEVEFGKALLHGGTMSFDGAAFKSGSVNLLEISITQDFELFFCDPKSWDAPPKVPWGAGPIVEANVEPNHWPPDVKIGH